MNNVCQCPFDTIFDLVSWVCTVSLIRILKKKNSEIGKDNLEGAERILSHSPHKNFPSFKNSICGISSLSSPLVGNTLDTECLQQAQLLCRQSQSLRSRPRTERGTRILGM